jgi:hypothetical protein
LKIFSRLSARPAGVSRPHALPASHVFFATSPSTSTSLGPYQQASPFKSSTFCPSPLELWSWNEHWHLALSFLKLDHQGPSLSCSFCSPGWTLIYVSYLFTTRLILQHQVATDFHPTHKFREGNSNLPTQAQILGGCCRIISSHLYQVKITLRPCKSSCDFFINPCTT